MMNANIKLIAEKLINKTDVGQAIWTKTSRDSEFKLELTKGAITTDTYEDGEYGTKWIDLCIYNVNGDIIEREAFNENHVDDYAILQKVYESATKSYYKIDETMKTIFDELDGEKIVGRDNKELPF